MSTIWIDEHSRLKSYRASVNGAKSVVTINIECCEPGSLGYLLEALGHIDREQVAKAKSEARPAKKKLLALPAPNLRIDYDGGAQ